MEGPLARERAEGCEHIKRIIRKFLEILKQIFHSISLPYFIHGVTNILPFNLKL
jgi:hypothetical protein